MHNNDVNVDRIGIDFLKIYTDNSNTLFMQENIPQRYENMDKIINIISAM